MNKVYELDDSHILFILNQFTEKELNIIQRYNDLVGKAIKEKVSDDE